MAKGESRIEIARGYCAYLGERLTGTRGIRIKHDLGNFKPKDNIEIHNVNGGKRVETGVRAAEPDIGNVAAVPAY